VYHSAVTERLRIGDVATRSGVTRDAIRFYERSGLLDKPGRSRSRHRIYDLTTLERIRLVRQLQNCGLTIGDIKEILFLRDADTPVASKRLVGILGGRLKFLEERIANLEDCRNRLTNVMRDVAAARSAGYDVLHKLPDVRLPSPFRFGRRGKDL
jgi:DNA-binding transcriptional MerR regulator